MTATQTTTLDDFQWQRFPETDQFFHRRLEELCEKSTFLNRFRGDLLEKAGVRLIDLVDHFGFPASAVFDDQRVEDRLEQVAVPLHHQDHHGRWFKNSGGQFPQVCLTADNSTRIALQVDDVVEFLSANNIVDASGQVPSIEGRSKSPFRRCLIRSSDGFQIWVCQRHGQASWTVARQDLASISDVVAVEESFARRQRIFPTPKAGFDHLKQTVNAAIDRLGVAWACDLFFAAERNYWLRKNRAAAVQKFRQDRFGIGWANQDHHTYRSSRSQFAAMISVFEMLGFECRERFYAGINAGWGAQVLEQKQCGIVIFADVDMTADELQGDFSHDGLAEIEDAGTIGLWCHLHGEAIFEAGMHHLECTFDFDQARRQLTEQGVSSMDPFTDFEHLRQSFTVGERWPVDAARVQSAVDRGWIQQHQADEFLNAGAVGSHLEVLERNDGFKGFNQTGVSEIIQKTDPRSNL